MSRINKRESESEELREMESDFRIKHKIMKHFLQKLIQRLQRILKKNKHSIPKLSQSQINQNDIVVVF